MAQIGFSLIFNIKAVEKLKVDSPWYLRSSWYLAQVDCIQYLLIIYLTNWKLCANIDGGFAKIFAQILSSSWYLAQIGFSLIFDNKMVDKLKFCANIERFSVIFAQILSSSWYLIILEVLLKYWPNLDIWLRWILFDPQFSSTSSAAPLISSHIKIKNFQMQASYIVSTEALS